MKTSRCAKPVCSCSLLLVASLATLTYLAAQRTPIPPPTPGPMLSDGTMSFDTPDFEISLVRSSQTVAALHPKQDKILISPPAICAVERSRDGYYHLGDIDLRLREGTSGDWNSYSTALARTPINGLPARGNILAAGDLSPTLPADIPLQMTRTWEMDTGKLVLRFTLKIKTSDRSKLARSAFQWSLTTC